MTARAPIRALRPAAEALAASLPPLLVEAERVAATVAQGVHGRRRVGMGDAFWQYRRYRPGDPVNRIDWRPSAKTPHLFVREREWEAAESVWIWRDQSASMAYRSNPAGPDKAHRANLLALALAALLVRGGERVALLGGPAPPATGRAGLTRLAEHLERAAPEADRTRDLPPVTPIAKTGQIVLIGDFLAETEAVIGMIGSFAAQGPRGHLLQILDPAEEDMPFEGRAELIDPENGRRLVLGRAESLRAAYRDRLAAHRDAIGAVARARGWTFARHRLDHPPQGALLALYGALAGPGATHGRGA